MVEVWVPQALLDELQRCEARLRAVQAGLVDSAAYLVSEEFVLAAAEWVVARVPTALVGLVIVPLALRRAWTVVVTVRRWGRRWLRSSVPPECTPSAIVWTGLAQRATDRCRADVWSAIIRRLHRRWVRIGEILRTSRAARRHHARFSTSALRRVWRPAAVRWWKWDTRNRRNSLGVYEAKAKGPDCDPFYDV